MLVSLLKRFGPKLSLNDPRWGHKPEDAKRQEGRRPGEGPPDLDQMWRDFNARLNRLFGPRNGGNESGAGPGVPRDGRGAGVIAAAAGIVLLLIWLASGTFTVQDGKIAVVTTFGKNPQKTGAGLNWRWPYPIQSHELVDVSTVRTAEVGYRGTASNKVPDSTMLTDDENIIDIQLTVQYTLKDPIAWAFNNRDQELAVHQLAESAIREVVGRSKMDSVLYEGREKVAIDVSRMMQQMVDSYGLGVLITNVTVQGVQPPEQVQAAFNDAVSAGQDSAKAKNEGEAYANNVIPNARGRAFRLMQDAEAYRSHGRRKRHR